MNLKLIGCNHTESDYDIREQLTISVARLPRALSEFGQRFPQSEAVVLSTCNRIEFYTTGNLTDGSPSHKEVAYFLADVQGVDPETAFAKLFQQSGAEAVRHLFRVAASLDSMVVGEAQILSQVKRAYELATQQQTTGQFTHAAFQRALRVAKRVARETNLNRHRVSIPSVAVRDFARQIFERFDQKHVLAIGAGEMAKESLRYLVDEGVHHITVINRSLARAQQLALQFPATAQPWDRLPDELVQADLVICATGADSFVIDQQLFQQVAPARHQRPLFILDLAVPRNVDPTVADCLGVYLYSVDDLAGACERNRMLREKELPKAERIIDEETDLFVAELEARNTGPIIRRLKEQAGEIGELELERLLAKIDGVDPLVQQEIERSFGRLINKLLHPPLESLREEAGQPTEPVSLIDAMKRLFQLRD